MTQEDRCKSMTKYDGALLRCEAKVGHFKRVGTEIVGSKHQFLGSDCLVEWDDGEKPVARSFCVLADCDVESIEQARS